MQIHGLQKTTLLDYPGRVACTIFTGHCNFRCPFCHNPELVLHPDAAPCIPEDELFAFLQKRKGILSGICISGGEPTLQPDLIPFLRKIKDLGYSVKLDTNGYRPDVLQQLLEHNLLDMVAMDIKSCLADYPKLSGLSHFDSGLIQHSRDLLMSSQIPYEFRTTILPTFHSLESLLALAEEIRGCKAYFLQAFQNGDILSGTEFPCFSENELQDILSAVQAILPVARLRGTD